MRLQLPKAINYQHKITTSTLLVLAQPGGA
jgi:hypothetical protein